MLRMTIDIDTATDNVIGTKDAIVQILEQYGDVRFVRCELVEPKQTAMWKER